jgi:PAS domain-containing protein
MELRVLWANKSACKSVNLELEQVIGRFCYTIWPKRSTPCEDCPVNRSRMAGMSISIEKQTPDGRYWQISVSPIFDTNDQMIALVELTLDITNRVQAEEDLKRVQIDQEQLIKKRTLSLTRLTEKLKKEIEGP